MDSSTECSLIVFCQEHCLSVDCFEKIKEIIMKDKIKIDKQNATAWYMKFEQLSLKEVPICIKENYPKIYKYIRHGDLIINTNRADTGHFDIYFVVKRYNKIKLISPENGTLIPKKFKVIESYRNLNYWSEVNDIAIKGECYEFMDFWWNYAYDFDYVPISDNLKKRIKPITDSIYDNIVFPDSKIAYLYDNYSQDKISYFRYKNKLYLFPENQIINDNYINSIQTVVIDVISRWKLIRCCIKFLSLHKRAVERVNHPDRLKQLGIFEL